MFIVQIVAQHIDELDALTLPRTQHPSECHSHQRRVGYRSHLNQPRTIPIRLKDIGSNLERKACLARSTRSGQRQQPRSV